MAYLEHGVTDEAVASLTLALRCIFGVLGGWKYHSSYYCTYLLILLAWREAH